jgi:hypothetical protein
LARLKRLVEKNEEVVVVRTPITASEIADRVEQYDLLDPSKFSKRYNDLLYRPVSFLLNEKEQKIQYNFCGNPFCKWHGLPQEKFTSVKGNPSRYRLSGRGKGENQAIICNDDPIGVIKGMTWGCTTSPVSNWSVAKEIKRLVQVETIKDVEPKYVFRSDVAYDWNIDINDIKLDTVLLKEDHLNEFSRKHGRFRKHSFYPQPPSKNDTQTDWEYKQAVQEFERRENYIDGLHVNSTYTTFAHLWLIKQMIKASEWRFVTDKDNSLMTVYSRVFARELRLAEAHHFICMVDREKSLKQCNQEYKEGRADLLRWGNAMMHDTRSIWQLGYLYLIDVFKSKQFHKEEIIGSRTYHKWAENAIEHPIPTRDKGFFYVDCKTDLSSLEPEEIANLVLNVSDYATNNFMQQIRRRLYILERPLVTARGDGKSYIYANFNPKYAQYALTILQTFYNFCEATKDLDGEKRTPAQRLGITDRIFEIKDILYLR